MMGLGKSDFWGGLGTSVPLILGYFPIAFSYGVAATQAGLSGGEAFALSLIIYAGAAQFLAVALISSGAPWIVAVLTLVAMNLRHMLYGPSLMKRAGQGHRLRHAWAWAFGLTDEVFGAALGAMARGRAFSEPFMFGLGLGAYAAWLSGSLAGILAGGGALQGYPAITAGLGFMLPALFLALLLSILTRAQVPVIAIAAATTVGVTLTATPTAGLLAGMLAGAVAGLWAWQGGAMRIEVLSLALTVGLCTWALRYVPLRLDLSKMRPDGRFGRFLAATGPAAIGTLFVAEIMPYLRQPLATQGPLIAGVLAVIAGYAAARSAVLATIAGSVAFGVATAILGG